MASGRSQKPVRAGKVALAAGVLIFVGKLATFRLTGSSAVFSDAMESVVNVAAAGLLLYSVTVAARPADRDHPYGHGKVEFFAAGVEGALIAFAAVMIFYQSALDIVSGSELRRLDLGLIAIAALSVLNALVGRYLIAVGRRTHSIALIADGKHLFTDVVTSGAVLAGLALVKLTGIALFDPLVAMGVAVNILRTGWKLLRGAVGSLMDEADESRLQPICNALATHREPWWIDVHSLRSWCSGPIQHSELHLAVPRFFDADQLHQISERVQEVTLSATGLPGDVLVHFDPCRPRQCSACAMEACEQRAHAFVQRESITLGRATRGDEALDTGEPVEPNGALR
jgi:cation diffusion facilitator family transporter